MKQPMRFGNRLGQVYKLQKSIYGLKQARNVWYEDFDKPILKSRYTWLCSDYWTYICHDKTDNISITIVWVDDIIGVISNQKLNNKLRKTLELKYEIKVTGKPALIDQDQYHARKNSQIDLKHVILTEC